MANHQSILLFECLDVPVIHISNLMPRTNLIPNHYCVDSWDINKVYRSRHVLFNELHCPFTDVYRDLQAFSTSILLPAWHSGVLTTYPSTSASSADQSTREDVSYSCDVYYE